MTDLISFVPQSTASSSGSSDNALSGLSDNFDTFLSLLTAQMQNQDPLSPLDSTEFTNQLVQFSSVEQQIQTNDSLESLLASQNTSTGAALAGYLGQEAEITTSAAALHSEDLTWRFRLPSDSSATTLNIQDSTGQIIWSQDLGSRSAGAHDIKWSGQTGTSSNPSDVTAPKDAVYTAVITAEDANQSSISTEVNLLALVTGVDMSNPSPAITTGAGVFSYADIVRITGK